MNIKMTFTIPEEVAGKLRDLVPQRKRSAFIASALREKLQELEGEQLRQRLAEDYAETREEDRLINQEWEAATLESWP